MTTTQEPPESLADVTFDELQKRIATDNLSADEKKWVEEVLKPSMNELSSDAKQFSGAQATRVTKMKAMAQFIVHGASTRFSAIEQLSKQIPQETQNGMAKLEALLNSSDPYEALAARQFAKEMDESKVKWGALLPLLAEILSRPRKTPRIQRHPGRRSRLNGGAAPAARRRLELLQIFFDQHGRYPSGKAELDAVAEQDGSKGELQSRVIMLSALIAALRRGEHQA